jgi:molecular chaperone HscA
VQFLKKHAHLINNEEQQATQHIIDQLQGLMSSDNKEAILKTRDELNDITRPFAERVMDVAVSEALKGKTI